MNDRFEIGDMVRVARPFYNHVGIVVECDASGPVRIIHNDENHGVILSTANNFSGGQTIFLHKKGPVDYFQKQQVVNRAFSLLGTNFNLLLFNCEPAANWAQSEQQQSPQLAGILIVVFAVIGLGVAGSKG